LSAYVIGKDPKGKSNSGEINKEIQLPVNEVTLNVKVIQGR
jgi:hypothetical protein